MRQFAYLIYAYESILYLFVFALHCLILAIVLRSPWRQHLRWAMPTVVGSSFACAHLLIVDLRVYGHLFRFPQIFLVEQATYVCATLIGLYSLAMLYIVIKQSLQDAAGKDLFTQPLASSDPAVWPPPPRVST